MVGVECSFSCRQSRDEARQYQAGDSKETSKTIWVSFGHKEESCGYDFHKRLLINIIESCERFLGRAPGRCWHWWCAGVATATIWPAQVSWCPTHTPWGLSVSCDQTLNLGTSHNTATQQSPTVTISKWQQSRLIPSVILFNITKLFMASALIYKVRVTSHCLSWVSISVDSNQDLYVNVKKKSPYKSCLGTVSLNDLAQLWVSLMSLRPCWSPSNQLMSLKLRTQRSICTHVHFTNHKNITIIAHVIHLSFFMELDISSSCVCLLSSDYFHCMWLVTAERWARWTVRTW